MEYIEREALPQKKELGSFLDDNFNAGWNACLNAIASIPAADVRPVVKAKWVYTDMSRLVCSNCGNPVAFALKDNGWYHGDFCPNCGAKMEES